MKERSTLLLVSLLLLTPLAPQTKRDQPESNPLTMVQAIVFESYLTPPPAAERAFEAIDLDYDGFPMDFSHLFAASDPSPALLARLGQVLPRDMMFLDIFTFSPTAAQIKKNRRITHQNRIHDLEYGLSVRSRSADLIELELDGRHAEMKFRHVAIEISLDKTKMVRIRHSASRTLFIALTSINLTPCIQGAALPKSIDRPTPSYPSLLSEARWTGRVRILATVDTAGKVDQEGFVLLECPHYLFARNSLDVVLNRWRFHPATMDGTPIEARATIEVVFTLGGGEM